MDNMWWGALPNSVRFVNDIVTAFKEGSSVVCVLPESCEWTGTFRKVVKDKILSGVDKTYEISGKDMGECSPGEYLAERFIKSELRARYRTAIGYEAFLTRVEAESSLIHSYVYISGLDEKQTREWLDFIYKYNKLHAPDSPRCKFIIESAMNVTEETKDIKIFRRNEYLHNYDITIFCMMATSSLSLPDAFREYLAELSMLSAHEDPEFAAELIKTGEEFIQDTHKVVDRIVHYSVRSDFNAFKSVDNLNRIIWKAQHKVFFPLIERYRLDLLKKYEQHISANTCITNKMGEEIESVYDIELGTVRWLCDTGDLYLPKSDYDEMKFFKQCRDGLAHLKPLPFESLKKIAAYVDAALAPVKTR